jgi:hypothetical protein
MHQSRTHRGHIHIQSRAHRGHIHTQYEHLLFTIVYNITKKMGKKTKINKTKKPSTNVFTTSLEP